jgi:predicted nucleotidyltransferase
MDNENEILAEGLSRKQIILEGITGSRAYGLDTESSDTDIKGIYVAPTRDILGLYNVKETIDHVDPDWVYREVGKFIQLAMKGNPTILELLFLDGYLQLTKTGKMLVDNRHLFLSNVVYKSYGGYALSQARKLNARGGTYGSGRGNRYEKHTRHCFRLLFQGRELLETGTINVRVTPEMREKLFAIGKMEPNEIIDRFEKEFAEFDKIKSVLPDKPNKEEINKLLLKIRKGN